MNKKRILIVLCGIVFIIGIVMIMKSVPYAHAASMTANVGNPNIDQGSYLVKLEGYIASYRDTGIVLAILAGFGILFETRKMA